MEARYRKPMRATGRAREREFSTSDEAENRLFDACCEVVDAAQELQRRAEDRRAAGAAMAAIGCLSAALEALAASAGSMREAVIGTHAVKPDDRRKAVAQRLEEARASLRRAAAACGPEGVSPPGARHAAGRHAWRL